MILKKEFTILHNEYTRFQTDNSSDKNVILKQNSNIEAGLDPHSFDIPLPVYKEVKQLPSQYFWTGNISKGHTVYSSKNVLYKNKQSNMEKTQESDKNIIVRKEERSQKMVNLIKQKGDVSIKDISYAFTDCSEKTIQRELNNLVTKGQLKKSGSKRWSRYSAV